MTELDFMRAILTEPKDDTIRLAFSDWLEENGQSERAEFIKLQIRIAEIEKTCGCGSCVKKRGGGQHTNGPCGVDQEREYLPDGRTKQARLRMREREFLLCPTDTNRFDVRDVLDTLPGFRLIGWDKGAVCYSPQECWPIVHKIDMVFHCGFPSKSTLTAADWIAYADQLAWHPEHSTDVCERCEGDGKAHGSDRPFEWSSDPNYMKCPICKGTGRVPRPMLPTAQPLEKITLTTMPEVYWSRDESGGRRSSLRRTPETFMILEHPYQDVVMRLLKKEWLWLDFVLP